MRRGGTTTCRLSGRAEPRLQPRLIGAAEPAQPRMSAMLETSDHAQSQRSAPEESRVNSRLGPVSELTARGRFQRQGRAAASAAAPVAPPPHMAFSRLLGPPCVAGTQYAVYDAV